VTVTFAGRRRLAAQAAVLAVAVGVLAIGWGSLNSPFAITLAVLCLLGAVGYAWVALTRRGPDRRRAVRVAVGLVVAAVVFSLAGRTDIDLLLLGAVAVAVSLPLGRYALGRDQRALAEVPPPGVAVKAAGKPVLVWNPRSGGGKAARLGLVRRAAERGVECREFGPGQDLTSLVREALAQGSDVIGVAGGDGSLAVVADLVSAAGAQMVCVPTGTRNHFAMDLGLDRKDPLAALDAFGPARMQCVDLARVNGRAFLNNVSMGVYGEVVQSANYRERKIETAVARLQQLGENPPDLRFTGPDGLPRHTVQVVHVSNNPYLLEVRGAGGRPRLDTGRLGIVAAELGTAAQVAEMFARAALGVLSSAPGFSAWTATAFEIASGGPIAAGIDGEAAQLDTPAEFSIEPGALQVRIPLHAVGRSPAAFVPQARHAAAEVLRRAFLHTDRWRPLPRR
jgi:diacylglycerol kinase family enzyme